TVLFEGAQGTLLDISFGTYPFVTSSSTIAGGIFSGCGVGPRAVDFVLAVSKAYSTRVGSGPLPAGLDEETGSLVRRAGGEFGTVTGRPRRCGWCDGVALRRAVKLNGADALAVTKLDVLSGFREIRIATAYSTRGEQIEELPRTCSGFEAAEPVYRTVAGWA